MSMSDCPKCWDTPCTCGANYGAAADRDIAALKARIRDLEHEVEKWKKKSEVYGRIAMRKSVMGGSQSGDCPRCGFNPCSCGTPLSPGTGRWVREDDYLLLVQAVYRYVRKRDCHFPDRPCCDLPPGDDWCDICLLKAAIHMEG